MFGVSECSPKQQQLQQQQRQQEYEHPYSLSTISYVLFVDVGAKTLLANTSDALPYVTLPETLVGSVAGRADGKRGGGLTLRCLCSVFGFDVLEREENICQVPGNNQRYEYFT